MTQENPDPGEPRAEIERLAQCAEALIDRRSLLGASGELLASLCVTREVMGQSGSNQSGSAGGPNTRGGLFGYGRLGSPQQP